MVMLESGGFFDPAGLEAFYADADPLWRSVNDSANVLQVGKESTAVHACYLLADAAFFLGQAPALNGSSCYRFFAADRADF